MRLFLTSTPGILIAGGSQRHSTLESQALNSQKLQRKMTPCGTPLATRDLGLCASTTEARARPWSGIEDPHTMRHSKQTKREVPREFSRSLLLKCAPPSTSSRGAWKPDRKAESRAQPRAAESDAIGRSPGPWRVQVSAAVLGSGKDRVLNRTVLPHRAFSKYKVPASYRTVSPLKSILNPADFQTSCWIFVGTEEALYFI